MATTTPSETQVARWLPLTSTSTWIMRTRVPRATTTSFRQACALALAVGAQQGGLDPEPILQREVAARHLGEGLLEVIGLDLGQEPDPPEVDAERRRRRIADPARRAQEGAVPAEHADQVACPTHSAAIRSRSSASDVPGLDPVGLRTRPARARERRGPGDWSG